MHNRAEVPNIPRKISSFLFRPQGLIFFLLIIIDVIIKLKIDLKKTNSKIGILLSTFLRKLSKLNVFDCLTGFYRWRVWFTND